MSTIELKSSLHNIIDTIEDKSMLSKAYAFLSSLSGKRTVDDYDNLPAQVKAAIEEGIAELNNGKGISYEEFRKEVKSKYNL